jgi:hypothetical protein
MLIAEVRREATGVVVIGEDGDPLGPFDQIICATGFRPDLTLTRELRLELDPAVEAPTALAPLFDPNVHSCGTVPTQGAEQLTVALRSSLAERAPRPGGTARRHV